MENLWFIDFNDAGMDARVPFACALISWAIKLRSLSGIFNMGNLWFIDFNDASRDARLPFSCALMSWQFNVVIHIAHASKIAKRFKFAIPDGGWMSNSPALSRSGYAGWHPKTNINLEKVESMNRRRDILKHPHEDW